MVLGRGVNGVLGGAEQQVPAVASCQGPRFTAAGGGSAAATQRGPTHSATGFVASACGHRAALRAPDASLAFLRGRRLASGVRKGLGILEMPICQAWWLWLGWGPWAKGSVTGADDLEPQVSAHGPVPRRSALECGKDPISPSSLLSDSWFGQSLI